MRKRLQKAFLLIALFSLSASFLGAVTPIRWADQIVTEANSVWDTRFIPLEDEVLNLEGTITVSGDVWIGAIIEDLLVTVSKEAVTIKPYNEHATAYGLEYGQLIFNPFDDRTITVTCFCDLNFTGSWGGPLRADGSTAWKNVDMVVTFSGAGQTIFKLNDKDLAVRNPNGNRGVQVYFTGTSVGVPGGLGHFAFSEAGTKVYICMNQTQSDALEDGNNQVLFQRMSYTPTSGGPHTDYGSYATGVRIGQGSFITFISNNLAGTVAGDPDDFGFGSLAFDPTHAGSGRMYLFLEDASLTPTCFHGGGLMAFGHYVPDYVASTIRKSVYLNQAAGVKALFRVVDDLRYDEDITDPTVNQGLLIINENQSLPKCASDAIQEHFMGSGYAEDNLAWGNVPLGPSGGPGYNTFFPGSPYNVGTTYYPIQVNIEPGFILGVNGWMDVYHRTFVDYVGAYENSYDVWTFVDLGTYITRQALSTFTAYEFTKERNSSAFFVDNLHPDWTDVNSFGTSFVGTDPQARIIFYGDAKLDLRSGVNVDGDINNDIGFGPWWNGTTWDFTFTIDNQPYNGRRIPSDSTTPGAGNIVFDEEGALSVYSLDKNDAPARDAYTDTITYTGIINMPTVLIDYTGQEIDENGDPIVRPLIKNTVYAIYNSPSMLFNLTPASLYDSMIDHNDVLKDITTNILTTEPAIINGGAVVMNQNLWAAQQVAANGEYYQIPRIQFFNSYLFMHESLGAAGVRFVTTELTQNITPMSVDVDSFLEPVAVFATDAENVSIFKFFDHGDALDTLGNLPYGRIFMAGSAQNKMIDHENEEEVTVPGTLWTEMEASTVWGFRTSQVSSPNSATDVIKLSIQADYDPAALLRYPISDPTDVQRAHHLFLLPRDTDSGANAFMSLGWTFTVGGSETYPAPAGNFPANYLNVFPWDAWENSSVGLVGLQFSITASINKYQSPNDFVQPATASIDGNYIYFGGFDQNGLKGKVPAVNFAEGSRIYVNHGGRIQSIRIDNATQAEEPALDVVDARHGYDCVMDLQLAYKLWVDGDPDFNPGMLSGIVDLPKDQVIFYSKFGTQPYGINTNGLPQALAIRLRAWYNENSANYNPINPGRTFWDRAAGEEYTIAWDKVAFDPNFHSVKTVKSIVDKGAVTKKAAVKSEENGKFKKPETRFTGIVDEPVALPAPVLMFTTGDVVTQLKVQGATFANPLNLLITGDGSNLPAGWVKEIVSQNSEPEVPGEGDHAAIFLNNGGRVGLGNLNWDEHSAEWNWARLGRDHVTICPDGGDLETPAEVAGIVDLNSDLYVADPVAIVPTTSFGADADQRLVIFSDDVKEIRVPAGQALDLSAFGQTDHLQIIEFAGQVRLVFEEGATLRLPDAGVPAMGISGGLVLYFNDESQLIFEGQLSSQNVRNTSLAEADFNKIKLVGAGQIWVNKDAKVLVMDPAQVSVRSDIYTPHTDITVSLQRTGQFMIGDENQAGGSFEIGNIADLKAAPYNVTDTFINFKLALGGTDVGGTECKFQINRQGFLGLAAGIVNKEASNPNSDADVEENPVPQIDGSLDWNPDVDTAWQVAGLYNVNNIIIDVTEGKFYHSNAFNGADERASLMAIGNVDSENPELGIKYFEFDIRDGSNNPNSIVYGGGNLMRLGHPTQVTDYDPTVPTTVNIWDYQDVIYSTSVWRDNGDSNDDPEIPTRYAMYGIFAPSPIVERALDHKTAVFPGATIDRSSQSGILFNTTSMDNLWKIVTVPPYRIALSAYSFYISTNGIVTLGATPFDTVVTYVGCDGTTIVRDEDPTVVGGTPEQAILRGVLKGSDENANGPVKYALMDNSNQ